MAFSSNKLIFYSIIGVLALGVTAAIASYATKESIEEPTSAAVQQEPKHPAPRHVALSQQERPAHEQKPQQVASRCDDGNIVGTAVGGIGGGLLGSAVGNGTGKTVATIGGALGGAYLGNQYIPTRGATCRQ